jgi:hypothetical protein
VNHVHRSTSSSYPLYYLNNDFILGPSGKIQITEMEVRAKALDAVSLKDGKIDLFITTDRYEICHRAISTGWETVGPGGVKIMSPKAVAHQGGSLAVFGVGNDAMVYGNVRERATGRWLSRWTMLSGGKRIMGNLA